MKILIIEDDKEINRLLSVFLTQNGYDTESSFDGVSGLNMIKKAEGDLDMMLPGFSGNEILTKIREFTDIPVIVISAVSALSERLFMMKNGADDYIIKPFELPDVLVRIEAVMRRCRKETVHPEKEDAAKVLSYGSINLDTGLSKVTVKGSELILTSKEFEILKLLLENKGKLFSKANLYESVWNEEYFPEDQSIKVHMSNLRSKLKKLDDFDYIETIWGMGYRLRKL